MVLCIGMYATKRTVDSEDCVCSLGQNAEASQQTGELDVDQKHTSNTCPMLKMLLLTAMVDAKP